MNPTRMPFSIPFFDTYSVGFSLYEPGRNNWRQRTIAGVSWNGREREAYFFNPDGLALPLEAHPWELPVMLRQKALRKEFSRVIGVGLFAMKPAQHNAMAANTRNQWVTYWLVEDSAAYANEIAYWAAYVQTDLQAEKDATESSYFAAQRRRPGARQSNELPWNEHGQQRQVPPADLSGQILENVESRRRFLQNEHARQRAEDQRIAAWLRGEGGDPPLLALMGGTAA